mmetsp:Transcript_41191/g.46022  ORF Transcript_41191/g.46022 Transcript_41191/m.46022 type:complete len:117 (-) Transcript_41191:1290-1640(-)
MDLQNSMTEISPFRPRKFSTDSEVCFVSIKKRWSRSFVFSTNRASFVTNNVIFKTTESSSAYRLYDVLPNLSPTTNRLTATATPEKIPKNKRSRYYSDERTLPDGFSSLNISSQGW